MQVTEAYQWAVGREQLLCQSIMQVASGKPQYNIWLRELAQTSMKI